MLQTSMKSQAEFERYSPQHPLPQELQTMQRDETVCQFCGVSYLIHNEIKALEEALKKTKEELNLYKGSVEKAQKLELQLEALQKELNSKLDLFNDTENRVKRLCDEKSELQTKLDDSTARAKSIEASSGAMKKDLEKYRDTSNRLGAALATRIKPNLANLCEDHSQLKNQVFALETKMKEEMRILLRNASVAVEEFFSKNASTTAAAQQKASQELRLLERERSELARGHKDMAAALERGKAEIEKLLRTHRETEAEVQELQQRLQEEVGRTRSATLEIEQHKETASRKAKEQGRWEQSLKDRERGLEDRLRKTEADLLQCQFDLQEARRVADSFRSERDQLTSNANDIIQKQSSSESEARELRQKAEAAEEEVRGLRSERQKMIVAHQARVEQLKESYKAKIEEAGGWTERLEAELNQAKVLHAREMAALEAKLKENSAMELEIQLQKHEEMLAQCKAKASSGAESEWRAKFSALEAHAAAAAAEHRAGRSAAEEKAAAEKAAHDREVRSLHATIEELRARLSAQPEADPAELLHLRSEAAQSRREAAELQDRASELERKLEAAGEQVGHLQDTVRRECEERFELTEKLSVMKEELLALRRPPQGYAPPRAQPRPLPEPSSPMARHGSLGSLQTGPPTSAKTLPASSGPSMTVTRRSSSGEGRGAAMAQSARSGTSVVATKRRLAALMAAQRRA